MYKKVEVRHQIICPLHPRVIHAMSSTADLDQTAMVLDQSWTPADFDEESPAMYYLCAYGYVS